MARYECSRWRMFFTSTAFVCGCAPPNGARSPPFPGSIQENPLYLEIVLSIRKCDVWFLQHTSDSVGRTFHVVRAPTLIYYDGTAVLWHIYINGTIHDDNLIYTKCSNTWRRFGGAHLPSGARSHSYILCWHGFFFALAYIYFVSSTWRQLALHRNVQVYDDDSVGRTFRWCALPLLYLMLARLCFDIDI